jgi:hypothetical protein
VSILQAPVDLWGLTARSSRASVEARPVRYALARSRRTATGRLNSAPSLSQTFSCPSTILTVRPPRLDPKQVPSWLASE